MGSFHFSALQSIYDRRLYTMLLVYYYYYCYYIILCIHRGLWPVTCTTHVTRSNRCGDLIINNNNNNISREPLESGRYTEFVIPLTRKCVLR